MDVTIQPMGSDWSHTPPHADFLFARKQEDLVTSWSHDAFFFSFLFYCSLTEREAPPTKLRRGGGLRGQEVATGEIHVTTASLTVELLTLNHTANMLTAITSTSQLGVVASLAS